MITLKRKIDDVLAEWKDKQDRLPLIVKGARQVGKTFSILEFANKNYRNVITINFLLQKQYKSIFNDGYEVDHIIKNISLLDPKAKFEAEKTLIFFDELQACPDCATSLKSFKQDGRFDVICSGSLMGINYQEIESNSVGYKEDYEMYSLDFEEFLWAKGYSKGQIENIYSHIIDLEPFSELELNTWLSIFSDYMITGGMPAIVRLYCEQGNFSGVLPMQKQLLLDYEEDITRYAVGLDKGRIKNVYDHISVFLAKENKKFMITKVSSGARTREYAGTVEWLSDAGIVNVCYCLDHPELPLRGNYNPTDFKLYYADTGLLIASLDEETQEDLRANRNFATYKGAIYENIVGDMLKKSGYDLYYYHDSSSRLEMDFFVRDANSLVPLEVKAKDNASASLRQLIESDKFKDIHYGIKLCRKNIGFNGKFYTFPYFVTFLLKRFLKERSSRQ